MKHNKELDFFKAVLIGLVILVHIVNFGELHPSVKSSILAFMMPSFLVITGYLVNVNKSLRDFMLYLLKIALPYVMAVMGYAVLSLYLPVRDGIQVLDASTAIHILFFKPLGPYWFFHVMIVCGTIYYATFRLLRNADTTVKYSIFASLLVVVALFSPFLNIKSAVYYFIGVGVRQAICQRFLANLQKKLVAHLSLWVADFTSVISRLGIHLYYHLRPLILLLLGLLLLVLERQGEIGR